MPTAVSFRRYVAHLVDYVVYVAAAAIPFYLLAERETRDRAPGEGVVDAFRENPFYVVRIDDRRFLFERSDLIIIGVVALAVFLLFAVVVQGRRGWTVGKALLGLRAVKADGEPPGIGRALLRTIVLVIDAIPSYVLPIVGGIAIAATDDNRRLGDLAAGTYVVGRSSAGRDPRREVDGDDAPPWESDEERPTVTTLAEGEPLRVGERADRDEAAEPGEQGEKAPAYRPQWDPARQAYLQWNPKQQVWLQYDDDAGEWRPIEE